MNSFIKYWDDVDRIMLKTYGIDTSDAGIDANEIASAQEANMSSTEFVQWWGEKYDLTPLQEAKTKCSELSAEILHLLKSFKQ